MPLLKQVGGERKLYTLRYWTSDGRAYELSFNAAESSEPEDVLDAFDLYARLEPEAKAPMGAKPTDSVNRVTDGWRQLVGDRLEPLRRLAQSAHLDLVEELLLLERAREDYRNWTRGPRERLELLADAFGELEGRYGARPEILRFALREALDAAAQAAPGVGVGAVAEEPNALAIVVAAQARLEQGEREGADAWGVFFAVARERVDLVEYLETHCGAELRQDGPDGYAGLCPFHADGEPSFRVAAPPLDAVVARRAASRSHGPRSASWRCYGGCKASGLDHGDLFDAVRKRNGLETREEALRVLNTIYDLELELPASGPADDERLSPAEREALAQSLLVSFVNRRQLSLETVADFGLRVGDDLRLHIPWDGQGHDRAADELTRALVESECCRACGGEVTAREWVQRVSQSERRRQADRRLGRSTPVELTRHCPRCGASPKESGLLVLEGQYPRFLTKSPGLWLSTRQDGRQGSRLRGKPAQRRLYNRPRAEAALASPLPAMTMAKSALWVVESQSDVWALYECGITAAVAYSAGRPNEVQLAEIVELLEDGAPLILAPALSREGRNAAKLIIDAVHKRRPRAIHLFDLESFRLKIDTALGGDPRAARDVARELDLAAVLALLGPDVLKELLKRGDYLDDVSWRVRDLLRGRRRDGTPLLTQAQEERAIQSIIAEAGYRPERLRLEHLLSRARPYWGREQVRSFIESAVEQAASERDGSERTQWIHAHGSADLAYALERGYDVQELYLQERVQLELGEGARIDLEGAFKAGKRNHPSRAAIQLERSLPARLAGHGQRLAPEQLRVVYLPEEGVEAVRVSGYLGLYTAYLPLAAEESEAAPAGR